ncbi:MAG: chemotaxis protein CheR [Betaproteobacteria bacterium]|nr:chemotaxis protein CheR [Betaproteobacteria bacterium]
MTDRKIERPWMFESQSRVSTLSTANRLRSDAAKTPALAPLRTMVRNTSVDALEKSAAARAAIFESLKKIDPGTREFSFTDKDFERVRELIHRHAGISLSALKQDMVYSRLSRRLRARGERRFSDYLDKLERHSDPAELEEFVNALTTNLTSFFREAHHFDTLRDVLRRSGGKRQFNIWCCASSTGEEAYSIAMTACEAFCSLTPPVKIIASDLDTKVLAHGERGVYSADRVERLSADRIQKYFIRNSTDPHGAVSARPELKRLLNFRRVNLLEPNWPVSENGLFDVIFCRNVMIYFDKSVQYGILKRFTPLLRPDGLLFAGHSENFMHAADLFRSLGKTVYARVTS